MRFQESTNTNMHNSKDSFKYVITQGGTSKKPTYFYNHCKISGHTIYRCFKIYGYSNKLRETVAVAIGKEELIA